MCGIAGIISTDYSDHSNMLERIRQMSDAIMYRGPDGSGYWKNEKGNVVFGHRRLKIIDLSNVAEQPMHYLNRYTITYNGEIYNYVELKNELAAKGYVFTTKSDTEVILAAYDHWKEAFLQYLDGMFAFAIWDEKQQQLFCARDRFGEKPFYFFEDGKQFLFASEMKALWAVGIARTVSHTHLLHYLTLGLVQNVSDPATTFFKNIYSLQPGWYLTLRMPDLYVQTVNYWDIDKETIDIRITEQQAIEKFSALLYQSVDRRLRSDVKIGASLSGGIDSSTIVSIVHTLCDTDNNPLPTFSAVFPGFEKDESNHIETVVKNFCMKNFCVQPEAADIIKDMDTLMYHQEEPFQSFSIYAQYRVYQLAKQHDIKVIFDGQGADEILAGYHKYYHWYWQQLIASRQFSIANNEIKAARSRGIQQPWGWKNKAAAYMPELAARQLESSIYKQQRNHTGIAPIYFADNKDKSFFRKPIVRKLNDILYFNTIQLGLQELLRYADRNSMASGVEARLPFLSHELVQFIFSLPAHFKIRDGYTKWILRKSVNAMLPSSIVWRSDKIGYEPPQRQWMQHAAIRERIMESRRKLIEKGILHASVLDLPIQAKGAHEDRNDDFRYLCAAYVV